MVESCQGENMDHIEILKRFIAIDTTVPPGINYDKAVDFLCPLFESAGFETYKIYLPETATGGKKDRVNLICHRRNFGKPRLIFYGHIDVVPAEGWDAFRPRVENGRIYGRGAADMKGAIVSLVMALDACKNKNINYDVSVMITTDEETNQADQLQYLRQYLEPVANASFFSLDSSAIYVAVTGLGVLQMDIKIQGKSVHSGLSHLGENAVEKASTVLDSLLELKSRVASKKSAMDAHPETGLQKMEPRLNINMIKGGLKVNIIPDECTISIDRRLIPEENIEQATKEIVDVLESFPGVLWETTVIIPPVPPCTDPMVDKLVAIIKKVTGNSGKAGEMGSGDLAPVVQDWGGQELQLGVIRSYSNIHGKNEFVLIKDIEDLAEIIAKLLTE
jgi:succinyl-diaminopimelate desuccinylase